MKNLFKFTFLGLLLGASSLSFSQIDRKIAFECHLEAAKATAKFKADVATLKKEPHTSTAITALVKRFEATEEQLSAQERALQSETHGICNDFLGKLAANDAALLATLKVAQCNTRAEAGAAAFKKDQQKALKDYGQFPVVRTRLEGRAVVAGQIAARLDKAETVAACEAEDKALKNLHDQMAKTDILLYGRCYDDAASTARKYHRDVNTLARRCERME